MATAQREEARRRVISIMESPFGIGMLAAKHNNVEAGVLCRQIERALLKISFAGIGTRRQAARDAWADVCVELIQIDLMLKTESDPVVWRTEVARRMTNLKKAKLLRKAFRRPRREDDWAGIRSVFDLEETLERFGGVYKPTRGPRAR